MKGELDEMQEIAEKHGLNTYCYLHDIYPFVAISKQASHNAIQYHMERINQLEQVLMDIIDAYDSEHGIQDAVEKARVAVYFDNR